MPTTAAEEKAVHLNDDDELCDLLQCKKSCFITTVSAVKSEGIPQVVSSINNIRIWLLFFFNTFFTNILSPQDQEITILMLKVIVLSKS